MRLRGGATTLTGGDLLVLAGNAVVTITVISAHVGAKTAAIAIAPSMVASLF